MILKLVDVHQVLPTSYGWHVVLVKPAVLDWLDKGVPNMGLYVELTDRNGKVFESPFITDSKHENKLPLLVLFNKNTHRYKNTEEPCKFTA